ncbi:MAG: NUDIX domain-containing protein [Bacteroidales bacterium]|nr:NUDIX domain-containing protein [Bacteroidales bacterium]
MNKFNIRVYGIYIENKKLLITDEFRLGIKMTKFPGGALNYGEGTIDCLKREMLEETGLDFIVNEHIYTTDYFQPTELLKEQQQLIAIYYSISTTNPGLLKTTDKKFDFPELVEGVQTFRWLPLEKLDKNEFTFPIDQKLASILKNSDYGS